VPLGLIAEICNGGFVKSVLVLGGAGYIGSHTCKLLGQAGYLPVAVDNLSTGHAWAVKYGPLIEADIQDAETLRGVVREHSIGDAIHFAAKAYVGESVQHPGKYFEENVGKTIRLLDTLICAGVKRVVFSSTCATYGNPESEAIAESHPQAPTNPYGESKLFVEKMLGWYAQAHGLRYVALRYFNAAGADPEGELGELHDPETHLIPCAIEAALGLRPHLSVYGSDYPTSDGTAVRDYTHVSDLARAHVLALRYLHGGGDSLALNLGTGKGHSVQDVIQSVANACGRKPRVRMQPRRTGDPAHLVADASKAKRILGWEPEYRDLNEIIGTAASWYKKMLVAESRLA
jgi:UDP-arabinose 4-epimerase